MLKPYFIKLNSEYIRIILAYQYFSIIINHKVYQFVPIEGQEIMVNRKTNHVVNTETKFAFQKGKHIIYMTLKKLTTLEDFMFQIEEIIKPYRVNNGIVKKGCLETENLIAQLEIQNIKRLIDLSLDYGDEEMFHQLAKQIDTKNKGDI